MPRYRTPARSRVVFVVAMLAFVALASVPAPSSAAVRNPVVEGPVQGGIHGWPWESSIYPVEAYGYLEQEFFITGTATRIADSAVTTLPYRTRIVVRRPAEAKHFNGTALVEWLNVTGQADLETLWPATGEWAMRKGYAWVGVSAQRAGTCCGPLSLKGWDPVRYAPIYHPGDDYSFDIFSQAMAAVRYPLKNRTSLTQPERIDPMGGLRVERVIAHGASQSAGRLTTYLTAGYHAAADVADAFNITRGGGNAQAAQVAADTDTLVVQVNEESVGARPADTDHYIVYEEAGISHAPLNWWNYTWQAQVRDAGYSELPDAVGIGCSPNRGTSQYTHRISIHHTQRWLEDGTVPPSGPRMVRTEQGSLVRDADGHALGGIRYPFVAVPTALNTSGGCALWGQYRPWSAEKVRALYPTPDDYVSQVDAVAEDLVDAGLLLKEDAKEVKAQARAFDVWGAGSCYDTASPAANEDGPVSSVLGPQAYSTSLLGAPNAIHEASCTIAPYGL